MAIDISYQTLEPLGLVILKRKNLIVRSAKQCVEDLSSINHTLEPLGFVIATGLHKLHSKTATDVFECRRNALGT